MVDFGKVLCSSVNELQKNSNASSREDYIPQILTVLLEIRHITFDLCSNPDGSKNILANNS